jgi:NhaP-type Na+/H+ or K+/H+ antiporter
MSQLNLGLAIAATSILLLGLASGYVKNRLWLSEPLIATLIGILAGPAFFDVAVIEVPEEQRTTFLIEFARITLAISIMGAALRLPPAWEVGHWRELLVVLGLGMPLMWLAGSALAVALLGLPLLYCVLIGAVLSPTDPVLAHMQDAVARFFDIPIFIVLGALLPWAGWGELGWTGIAFAAAILLLRRLPAWLLIRPLLPSVRTLRETAFNGWFGPIGIAAIFYAVELQHEPGVEHSERIWHIVSLVVFGSIILHGITATPLTLAFGRARHEPSQAEKARPR